MDEFAEIVHDASAILDEVNEWRLPPGDWSELPQLIEEITAAFTARDGQLLGHLIEELVLRAPDRAIPLGAERCGPAPAPLRERVNQLVHTLNGRPLAPVRIAPARK